MNCSIPGLGRQLGGLWYMCTTLALLCVGAVARAEEPLGTFEVAKPLVPAAKDAKTPRGPKAGVDPFEHADPLHFGKKSESEDGLDSESALMRRLVVPADAGHLNITGTLGCDFAGSAYAAAGASGSVWGIDTTLGADVRYVGDQFMLSKAALSLNDSDWHWTLDAGDYQTQNGGTNRGVRIGWRNGLLEPQAGFFVERGKVVGAGALTFLPIDGLTFGLDATTQGRANFRAGWDKGRYRFGAAAAADFTTGSWEARANGSFHFFDRLLALEVETRFVDDEKGQDLQFGVTSGWHFSDLVEVEVAYGQKGAMGGHAQHSLKGRASVTPGNSVRFAAQWATFFDDAVTTHNGSTSVMWRPGKMLNLVADASVEIANGAAKPQEHIGVNVTPIDVKQFAAIVRFDATLPSGELVPDLALGLDLRLPGDVSLRGDVTRDGARGDFTGNVAVSGALGVPAPSRGAEIQGRVADPNGHPIANVIVMAGNYRVATDEDGEFNFHPLPPGEYYVDVDERTLPAEQTAKGAGKTFKLGKRDTETISFVVKAYGKLRGRVCLDADGDGKCGADEGILMGLLRMDDRMTAPENDGTFAFDNVVPGHYDVKLDKDYLKKGFELVSPEVVPVDVLERGTAAPEFVLREIKKEIKFDEI